VLGSVADPITSPVLCVGSPGGACNAKDLCRAVRNGNFSSFAPCARYAGQMGRAQLPKAYGVGALTFGYQMLDPPPPVTAVDVVSEGRASAVVSVSLDGPGALVYCGAFPTASGGGGDSGGLSSVPRGTAAITVQANMGRVVGSVMPSAGGNSSAEQAYTADVTLTGLSPVTDYKVYCMSQSPDGFAEVPQ
jgi:hypothetical protein